MKQHHLYELRTWFDEYVAGFYGDDEFINTNVKLKEDHTRRTCQEMLYLADKLDLSDPQKYLAEIIALFHDIGRFEQFTKYRTFNDAVSIRHSLWGARILRQMKVLDSLEKQQQELIVRAVVYHAERQLPRDLDDQCLMYVKLIRDADKLDIYRVVTRHYKDQRDNPKHSVLWLGLPDDPVCSSHVVTKTMRGESVDYRTLRTLNDLKLMQLGWVYDINFVATLERIKKRGFLKMLADSLPNTPDIEGIKEKIFSYVGSKIRLDAVS